VGPGWAHIGGSKIAARALAGIMRFLVTTIALVVALMVGWHVWQSSRTYDGGSRSAEARQPGQVWPPKIRGALNGLAPSSGTSESPAERQTQQLQDQQELEKQRSELIQQKKSTPYEIETQRLKQQQELLNQQEAVLEQQKRIQELQAEQTAPAPATDIKPVTNFSH